MQGGFDMMRLPMENGTERKQQHAKARRKAHHTSYQHSGFVFHVKDLRPYVRRLYT